MKHKYAIIGGVVGLLLPSLLIVFFARLWGVEITDKAIAACLSGGAGVLLAAVGAGLGAEVDIEEDND